MKPNGRWRSGRSVQWRAVSYVRVMMLYGSSVNNVAWKWRTQTSALLGEGTYSMRTVEAPTASKTMCVKEWWSEGDGRSV